jgi:hypothetical protein
MAGSQAAGVLLLHSAACADVAEPSTSAIPIPNVKKSVLVEVHIVRDFLQNPAIASSCHVSEFLAASEECLHRT